MYPSVVDQINGVKRALKETIRPALKTGYERDVLHWSVRVLNLVAEEAVLAHPLNVREAAVLVELFDRILPDLETAAAAGAIPVDVVKRVRGASLEEPSDPTDVVAAEATVNRKRDVAAEVARALVFKAGLEAVTEAFQEYVRKLAAMNAGAFKMNTYD